MSGSFPLREDNSTTRTPKKGKRKVPKWLWRQVVIQLVIYELSGVINAIGALLILVKFGILQLAHLPVAALIALLVFEVFLIAVVIIARSHLINPCRSRMRMQPSWTQPRSLS
jgi:hypothetical protein